MRPIALITGATGGLGQAVVAQLQADHTLALVARNADSMQQHYGDAHCQIISTLNHQHEADQILQDCISRCGVPTVLVHCVGSIKLGSLHRLPEQDFLDTLHNNLVTAYLMLSAFVKTLKQHKQPGCAILISSAAARIGTQNHEAIAAAKAGLEGLVISAAASYASSQIRINAVAPGILETPAAQALIGSESGRNLASKQYPLPGIGDPAQVASLIRWLVSSEAGRVTGQVWAVDGGFSSIRPLLS